MVIGVQCSVVQCSQVWLGAVRCGVVRCSEVWLGAARCAGCQCHNMAARTSDDWLLACSQRCQQGPCKDRSLQGADYQHVGPLGHKFPVGQCTQGGVGTMAGVACGTLVAMENTWACLQIESPW